MKFIRIVPIFFIGACLSLAAPAATVNTQAEPLSKAEKLKALRRALSGGGANGAGRGAASSAARGHSRSRTEPAKPTDFRAQALSELQPDEKAYSSNPAPVLATVRTQSILAEDPVFYQGVRLGLTLSPYRPEGHMPLVNLGERDLAALPSTWMLGIDLRLLPWTTSVLGRHAWGLRVAGAYAGQNVKLTAPTGKDLGATKLHSFQSSLLLSQQWAMRGNWSWDLDLGVSRFDVIQTGRSSLAEASDAIWLAVGRTGPAYRFGRLSMGLDYEHRRPFTRGWAKLNESAWLLGVSYGLR
jgi:hypothetical protein